MSEPLGASSYNVRRFDPNTVVGFKSVKGSITTFDIRASIQPVGREVFDLPEGLRSRVEFKMYTTFTLHVVNNMSSQASDELFYDGQWYELMKAETHNAFAPLPHTKFYLIGPQV